MITAVTLKPGSPDRKTEVGDVVTLQVFFDAKIGAAGDSWEIIAPPSTSWLSAGGVTLSTASVRTVASDANTTKLEIEALIHQPGSVTVGPFTLRNQVTKEEYEVPFTVISESSAEAGTQPKEEPPWIHGAVSFGGWDWVSLGVLMAALLAVLLVSGRIAWKRLQKHLSRNFTYTERALHDLANLQKYMRSQKPLPLEEWKKFSFELAGILRKYSDRNFQLNSVDMTDREFLEELHGHREATSQVRLLADILGTITEVRYGRKALDASVIPGLLLDSKKFVESTSREKKEESRK